ncbi:MAG: virulence factor [Pseudomonadales bacterium]
MQKIIVYWRDIPAQLIVKRGRSKGKATLSQRFHVAIDRAAMRAGKGGSDEYLADWRRDSSVLDSAGDLQDLAEQEVARIELSYSDEHLTQLIANFGLEKV